MGFFAKNVACSSATQPPVKAKAHTRSPALQGTGTRLYEPTIGRWCSRDPLEEDGGMALYAFLENNSPNAVDPDGGFSFLVQTLPPDLVPSQAAAPAPRVHGSVLLALPGSDWFNPGTLYVKPPSQIGDCCEKDSVDVASIRIPLVDNGTKGTTIGGKVSVTIPNAEEINYAWYTCGRGGLPSGTPASSPAVPWGFVPDTLNLPTMSVTVPNPDKHGGIAIAVNVYFLSCDFPTAPSTPTTDDERLERTEKKWLLHKVVRAGAWAAWTPEGPNTFKFEPSYAFKHYGPGDSFK